MSGVEEALKRDFPEASDAECKRFIRACQDPKKEIDADALKETAEKLLEDYLDWRSCFGLDYKKADASNIVAESDDGNDDAADWDYAIRKALEVSESVKRAKEMEKKLAAEAKKGDTEVEKVNYDIDVSDSQKEDALEGEDSKETKDGSAKKEGASADLGQGWQPNNR